MIVYLIGLFGVVVIACLVVSLRMYFIDKHQQKPVPTAPTQHKMPRVPSYELHVWVDDEVATRRLYCKPNLSSYELANELGLDEDKLKSVIRNSYDKTVAEYLNERRVQAACRILRDQPETTEEAIRCETGFDSLNAFQLVFRKIMGMTPAKYRTLMAPQQR